MALRGLLEGRSNSRPILVICVIGVGLNIFFNNVLMFGWFGLPALGLVGTGYASSLVFSCMFLMFAGYIHGQYNELHIFRKIRSPDPTMMRELIRVGGPIGMTLGFEISMFTAAAIAMGNLGKNELAAHQIALQSASIAFMVPLGLAIATSARVGQAIGRKSNRDAEIAGHIGMLLCMSVMCVSAMAFWLAPRWIISWYIDLQATDNQTVIELASGFLAIAALFQVFDGLQVSASSALRGLKDTKAAMLLTLISYWCVGCVVGGILCFGLGMRGNGLWLGMTTGLATAALLLSVRFQHQVRSSSRI
jgi:MATE family multidrug resistance protein